MIYAINQNIAQYGVTIQSHNLGPYYNYRDRPALLAAVMMMTDIPFFWEEGSPVPVEERPSKLTRTEAALIDTLYEPIGRRMVTGLLTDLDPWQFAEYLVGYPLYTLPFCKTGYCTPEQLLLMTKARAGAWLLSPMNRIYSVDDIGVRKLTQAQQITEQVKKEIFANAGKLFIH